MAPATPEAVARHSPRSESERRQRWERYAADLHAHGKTAEAAWVRAAGQRVDALHHRLRRALDAPTDHARDWPPRGLAVWWEFGVILVQQLAVLLALWAGVLLLTAGPNRKDSASGPPQVWPWAAAHAVL